jgi:hypothetical protein
MKLLLISYIEKNPEVSNKAMAILRVWYSIEWTPILPSTAIEAQARLMCLRSIMTLVKSWMSKQKACASNSTNSSTLSYSHASDAIRNNTSTSPSLLPSGAGRRAGIGSSGFIVGSIVSGFFLDSNF